MSGSSLKAALASVRPVWRPPFFQKEIRDAVRFHVAALDGAATDLRPLRQLSFVTLADLFIFGKESLHEREVGAGHRFTAPDISRPEDFRTFNLRRSVVKRNDAA
jgi:hypothetical protein